MMSLVLILVNKEFEAEALKKHNFGCIFRWSHMSLKDKPVESQGLSYPSLVFQTCPNPCRPVVKFLSARFKDMSQR